MESLIVLKELGATPAVILIFVMGIMFASYAVIRDKQKSKLIEKLFAENKDLRYTYNVLNTWAFYADKTLKLNGLKCGNSLGDVMLDWDSVPGSPPK